MQPGANALHMLKAHAKQTLEKIMPCRVHGQVRRIYVEMNVLIAGTCKAVQVEQKF